MKPLVCCLLPRPPHPSRDGGAIRTYFLLRGLASEARVRALVLRPPDRPAGEYPDGVAPLEVPHALGAVVRAGAVLESLGTREAYPALLYRSPQLSRELTRIVTDEPPARVIALSYHLGPAAAESGASSWVDFQNVDSEIWRRLADTSPSFPARLFARAQAPLVEAFEEAVLREAGGVSGVSRRDAGALAARTPGRDVAVVPNGVDLARYTFRGTAPSDSILFFVGDLAWAPNADGVRWFLNRVWPEIRRRRNDARVEILARERPAELVRAAGPDVRFAYSDDTRPYWARAAVAIVPLLAGGGTRLKILEAAACGVPVVSTRVGAEGLDLETGSEIAIAGDASEFASEVVRLLADAPAARRQAEAARRKVASHYGWDGIGAAFARAVLERSTAR
jgi:glycosyltransferase involved in cell wall biosynthesis